MQTDLRLLLLIVGLVYAVYTLYNIFSSRQKKTHKVREKFEQTMLENQRGSRKSQKRPRKERDENDPLLENFADPKKDKKESQLHTVSKFSPSKEFVDNQVDFEEKTPDPLGERKVESPSMLLHSIIERKKQPEKISQQQIISFSMLSKQQHGFSGRLLLSTLRANHFHFDNKIFHSYVNNNPAEPIECSIACLVEPGIFDWQQIAVRSYPGLVIWIKLSGTENDAVLFEKLLSSAKQIASALNATLCDDNRHPLSVQSIALYRARIKDNCNDYFRDEVV